MVAVARSVPDGLPALSICMAKMRLSTGFHTFLRPAKIVDIESQFPITRNACRVLATASPIESCQSQASGCVYLSRVRASPWAHASHILYDWVGIVAGTGVWSSKSVPSYTTWQICPADISPLERFVFPTFFIVLTPSPFTLRVLIPVFAFVALKKNACPVTYAVTAGVREIA